MTNFKTKIKYNIVEAISCLIAEYFTYEYIDMDDKLVMAALEEVRLKMQQKMLKPQQEYPFTFSATQAIAISIWFDDYIKTHTTQVGNKLHTISNHVKKQYQ
jgi:hypothetical protein